MIANTESTLSKLSMMPDQALKQMAMMHQSDPYMLPLIISEDTRRKQTRQAAMAQQQGGPAPKVIDEAIAGIGQLPPPQMPQGAPQGAAPGQLPPRPQQPPGGPSQAPARPAAAPQGMPQGAAPQGARPPGIGGLPPQRLAAGGIVGLAAGGMGPTNAAERGMSQQLTAPMGGSPAQILAEIQRAEADLAKVTDPADRALLMEHIQSLKAQLAPGRPAERAASDARAIASELQRPTAGPVQREALGGVAGLSRPTSGVDQIPLPDGTYMTPAKKEQLAWEAKFKGMDPDKGFARWLGEDVLGMSRDTSRQLGHASDAVAPAAMPATGAMNGIGALSRLARGAAVVPALSSPATPKKLGEKIGQTLPLPEPETKTAGISSLGASNGSWDVLPDAVAPAAAAPGANKELKAGQDALISAAKEVTPKKERKGMTDDDWLMLGLQLLSNKSPRFLTALGESGIATLQAKTAREKGERDERRGDAKDELDARKGNADIDKDKAQAEYYRATAKSMGVSNKDLSAALKAGNDAFDDWAKGIEAIGATGAQRAAKREEFIQKAMQQYGIAPATGTASYSAAPMPAGVKVTRKQ